MLINKNDSERRGGSKNKTSPRNFSDDKKPKKSIFKGEKILVKKKKKVFKDVYVNEFHIAEHHFIVKFTIFDEIVTFTLEKDKKINKDKLKKKLAESAKNWKSASVLHFNQILAFILNKCSEFF